VIEVADILRLHGRAYAQTHRLLPSQQKAMGDLVRCRTPACGGQLYECDRCGAFLYSYHSCGNRHCPKCHTEQTERWLGKQRAHLLDCPYYFLTFTLPSKLRPLLYAHQKPLYGLLLQCAAAALQKLSWDPQYVGAELAMLAVLHTWRRDLLFHPHVHILASAGGLSRDGQQWVAAKNPAFLVPGYALSQIFRGKFRAALKPLGLLDQVDPIVWQQKWNVQIQHAGRGQKVLDYLGRYAFRVAISNSRLECFENGTVTFGFRDNKTHQLKHLTLKAEEFIQRFLQHCLPKGFVKVRSYGLWHANAVAKFQSAQKLLALVPPAALPLTTADRPLFAANSPAKAPLRLCPSCKSGHLILKGSVLPQRTRAP
jgi:hypothetical protein